MTKVLFPIALVNRNNRYMLACFNIEPQYFTEPFFLDTLSIKFNLNLCSSQDDSLALVRRLDLKPIHDLHFFTLQEFLDKYLTVSTSNSVAFIYHMSRCGSTLLTQMLSTNDKFYVISEPPIINHLLDPQINLSSFEVGQLLRSVINCISTTAPLKTECLFIKFRSWNIFFIDKINNLFKQTPWCFIHRPGEKVLQSILRKPPGWLRSQTNYCDFYSSLLNCSEREIIEMDKVEFISRILGRFCSIAFEQKNNKSYFINYETIEDDIFFFVERFLKINLTLSDKSRMKDQMQFYSKDPAKQTLYKNINEKLYPSLDDYHQNLLEKFVAPILKKLTN